MKKLTKSRTNKVISGVCGGVAQYLNLDPTIVRVVWALITFFGGSGIILYIICAIVMPEEFIPPHDYTNHSDHFNNPN